MAKTGLLIGIHGAGLENIMFMPKRSAVIEIFPYGIYCPLYAKVAATMQLQVPDLHSFRSRMCPIENANSIVSIGVLDQELSERMYILNIRKVL